MVGAFGPARGERAGSVSKGIPIRYTRGWTLGELEPQIELAVSKGLKTVELTELQRIIEERQNEIRQHWHRHFRRRDS